MHKLVERYKLCFREKDFIASFFSGLFILFVSFVGNYFASAYATITASSPVTDLILSNTRVWDVDGLFVYGAVVCFFVTLLICLWRPKTLPFVLKSWGLFILIRAVFVTLTHLGPFPTEVTITPSFFGNFFTGNDLFFSGHTGAPFLIALMFWEDKFIRYLYLAFSVLFAIVVLLGHLHYSIDVLSAFFITYSIYHICLWLFKRDRQMFLEANEI